MKQATATLMLLMLAAGLVCAISSDEESYRLQHRRTLEVVTPADLVEINRSILSGDLIIRADWYVDRDGQQVDVADVILVFDWPGCPEDPCPSIIQWGQLWYWLNRFSDDLDFDIVPGGSEA